MGIDGFDEIIAVRYGSIIYFAEMALDKLRENIFNYDQLLSKAEFKLLTKFDLGDKWAKYAENALTILKITKPFSAMQRNPKPYSLRDF